MSNNSPTYPLETEQEAARECMTNLAIMSNTLAAVEKENRYLNNALAVANRKKRRQITRQELGTNSNGEIVLVTQYDDGEREGKPFITNARGNMNLYLLCPADCHIEPQLAMIMLEWESDRILVMGFLSRMGHGRYIYQQMQTAEILFNPEIPSRLIYKLLEDWFFRMRNKAGSITSKLLHGWKLDGRTASFLDNSPLVGFPSIADEMKIRRVSFERVELTEKRKDGYISELLQFKEDDTRLMFFLAPFFGLLKSLIDKFIGGQTVYINLVAVSEMPISMISSWIQVSNRNLLSDGSIEQSDRERKQWMEQLSDENLILDVRGYAGESEYSLKKKRQFLVQCADMVRNQRYLPGTKKRISAALFSVSDSYEAGGALNIILPDYAEIDRDKHKTFIEDKCLEAVMSAVVDFVESNFANVAQILRKSRTGESNQNIFSAVTEVLQVFFEAEGIDIMKRLQISNDFSKLFESTEEEENMVGVFIATVRSEISKYKAVSKYEDYYEEGVVYYDRGYIYFPKGVIEGMYQSAYRGNQWERALLQLREEGYMSTSSPDVLVKKLQVGGVRHNFYVIERELFNVAGFIEIIDLAKEA